jgi:hypothetical protein
MTQYTSTFSKLNEGWDAPTTLPEALQQEIRIATLSLSGNDENLTKKGIG